MAKKVGALWLRGWILGFAAVFAAAGCGGSSGGFPSGLGGGLVDGAKRSVFVFFGSLPSTGSPPRVGRVSSRSTSGPGAPNALLPPPGATKAYVSIQGAGYLGSNIYLKPVLFPNSQTANPNGDLTTSPLMTFSATVTTGANSTTQTLSTVAGLAKGDWLQFGQETTWHKIVQTVNVNSSSVILDSAVNTTASESVVAGAYVQINVPTHKTDTLDSDTDPGVQPSLFNMGFTRLVLVDYQDDSGHELGVATFSINPDPPTGGTPLLYLNDNTKIPTNPPPDLTAHEGRLVEVPVSLSGLPQVTPADPALGLTSPRADLAQSVVITLTETNVDPNLTANTFSQTFDITPSMYTGNRALQTVPVLVADRGFLFSLTAEVHAALDGNGVVVASGTNSDIGTLPLQVQPYSLGVNMSQGLHLAMAANPLLLTAGQTVALTAFLVDGDGNETPFQRPPGQALNLTIDSDPTPILSPPVTHADQRAMDYQVLTSGLATIHVTTFAEPITAPPGPYPLATGPVQIQAFSNQWTVGIGNLSSYLIPPSGAVQIPYALDLQVPFVHLDLALLNHDGSSFVLPRPYDDVSPTSWWAINATSMTVDATHPNDPSYPNLTPQSMGGRRPNWLELEGVGPDPNGLITNDTQLIFRATGVSNNASPSVLDHDLPITIQYSGYGVGSATIPVILHAFGGSGGGGIR